MQTVPCVSLCLDKSGNPKVSGLRQRINRAKIAKSDRESYLQTASLSLSAEQVAAVLEAEPARGGENTIGKLNRWVILKSNFEVSGLVFSCIETKFCKKILVGKLSPRSTQCTPLHRSLISKFSSIFFFFSFLLEETRPRVETEGMTLPQPPESAV